MAKIKTVGELRKMLDGLPADTPILSPINFTFAWGEYQSTNGDTFTNDVDIRKVSVTKFDSMIYDGYCPDSVSDGTEVVTAIAFENLTDGDPGLRI